MHLKAPLGEHALTPNFEKPWTGNILFKKQIHRPFTSLTKGAENAERFSFLISAERAEIKKLQAYGVPIIKCDAFILPSSQRQNKIYSLCALCVCGEIVFGQE
jgi:hypothetical protein